MSFQNAVDAFNAIVGLVSLGVLACTAVIVWIYTRAAQRSNEIQEEPVLTISFEDTTPKPYLVSTRFGTVKLKNIGKGPAYNISFEPFFLKEYRYSFYLKQRILESQEEVEIESPAVKTPSGGTEGHDANLMRFLFRAIPQTLTPESRDAPPIFFVLHYQGTSRILYHSVFAFYSDVPVAGDLHMHFLTHGQGRITSQDIQGLWEESARIKSPYEHATISIMKKPSMDVINKWLTAAQSLAIIFGLIFTVLTLRELVTQTKIQNETLAQTQAATSAEYSLEMENRLDESQYNGIYSIIEYGAQSVPLLVTDGGPYSQAQVEDYIGNLDDIGTLLKSGVISPRMAYDEFSDQVEETWCNNDVQKVISIDRKEDHTKSALSDPYYDDFQYMATQWVTDDGGCSVIEEQ